MPTFRSPDPPDKVKTFMAEMEVENDNLAIQDPRPPEDSGANGLVILISQLIDEPANYMANGEITLSKTMIKLIRILVQTEKNRQEANTRHDEQLKLVEEQIKSLVNLQEPGPPVLNNMPSVIHSRIPMYAELTSDKTRATERRPTVTPPAGEDLTMLCPGRAIIHSNPMNTQIDKIPKALFVQRANVALEKMNAKVQGELVVVTGAHMMNSGDVVFYTKNKIHQEWLMENKHLWSKQVHTDLEATPSTWLVLVHGIPKEFNPTLDLSKANIAVANHLRKEDIVRMRWLSDNINTAKKAGSIVLSLAIKDLAKRLVHAGIFLDYDFHRVTKFKPYPAQCFKCLRMGHFGKWCRRPARCGRCDKKHMTKECLSNPEEITECVRCKEGLQNKEKGIEDTHHSVFQHLLPIQKIMDSG